MIKVKNLKYFDSETQASIIHGIDFEIVKNRCTLFIGKSGSGKTTILRCLTGLASYSGTIETTSALKKVGFVSQAWDLFPHMSVLDNCIHPQVKVLKIDYLEAKKKALEVLESLGLKEWASKYPHQLSGGQRQRVAIARALVMDTQCIAFDEPTSALDPQTTGQFKLLIDQLLQKGITPIISTHDMNFVKSYMDRVYLVQSGNIIESFDSQKDVLNEASLLYQYVNY